MPESRNGQDMLNRCTGVNRDGSPCKARAQRDSDFCLSHDPERVTELAEWRRKGGHAASNAARAQRKLPEGLLSTRELQGVLGLTIGEVRAGSIEVGVANAIANLARAYMSVSEASGVEALEQDVAELRELVAARGLA